MHPNTAMASGPNPLKKWTFSTSSIPASDPKRYIPQPKISLSMSVETCYTIQPVA